MPNQLDLFGDGASDADPGASGGNASVRAGRATARAGSAAAAGVDALERRFEPLRLIAHALPGSLRFGTSSWSFPGWHGLVYPRKASVAALARDGLRLYVRHPLLTTVGVDRSYYAPIPGQDLRRYTEHLPPGFPCCAKAPASVTSAARPTGAPRSADPNPDFLSAERFIDDILDPFDRDFRGHAGPFILQFPPAPRPLRLGPAEFAERLDRFLEQLPRHFRYAIEIRQQDLLCREYAAVLARHGAAHVYNYWSAMPMPGPQADAIAPESQPFVVVRLLLRPGAGYEEQREAFAPFDRIHAPSEPMRGQVIDIVARAVARRLPAFVLVNNKAEGSAPLTIEALASGLVDSLQRVAGSTQPAG